MGSYKPQTPIMNWAVYNDKGIRTAAFVEPGDALDFVHTLGEGYQIRYRGGTVCWQEQDEYYCSREERAESIRLMLRRAEKTVR
jgi:hypothetical protein